MCVNYRFFLYGLFHLWPLLSSYLVPFFLMCILLFFSVVSHLFLIFSTSHSFLISSLQTLSTNFVFYLHFCCWWYLLCFKCVRSRCSSLNVMIMSMLDTEYPYQYYICHILQLPNKKLVMSLWKFWRHNSVCWQTKLCHTKFAVDIGQVAFSVESIELFFILRRDARWNQYSFAWFCGEISRTHHIKLYF